MEHRARRSAGRIIAIGFLWMGILNVFSLAANIIQGVNNYRLQNEQRTVITPMIFQAPFAVSQNQMDASYLQQMGLSFIALRLNVSPETVDAQHQALLSYVRPASQNTLRVKLAEDAKQIKGNNVNSAFFMTDARVFPASGRVTFQGELKTWIGDSAPYSEIKRYELLLVRVGGVTWLARFAEVKDEQK